MSSRVTASFGPIVTLKDPIGFGFTSWRTNEKQMC